MSRSVLLFAVSCSLALLTMEGVLRVMRPAHAEGAGTRYTAKAELYGWALPPRTRLAFYHPDTGKRSVFTTNSAGWKDVEHRIRKRPGTFRILFVGDSYTYGYCPLEALYTRQVEKLLHAAGRPEVEVLSMGVGSWGTDHALEVLRREGLEYGPDLVVYQFCANDVTDNIQPDLRNNMDPIHWYKPFKYEIEGGKLVRRTLNPVFKYESSGFGVVRRPIRDLTAGQRLKRFLLMKSSVLYNMKAAIDRLAESKGPRHPADAPVKDAPELHPIYDPDSPYYKGLRRGESPPLDSAFSLFDLLLHEMQSTVAAAGARYLVFSVSDFWREELEESCRRNGVRCLLPPPEGYERYLNDGHMNDAGNSRAARAIVTFLLGEPWLDS